MAKKNKPPVKKYEYDLRGIERCRCIVQSNKTREQAIKDLTERKI